ncbi:hypothetical protein HYS47_01265 [Candidatus Woesearchaeota archaeon]|nr:hypothetical protein [Candidatus Woesearchaeota archaeon]
MTPQLRSIDDLMAKRWDALSEEEAPVVQSIMEAMSFRRELEEQNVPLTIGVIARGVDHTSPSRLELDSFHAGVFALEASLRYLTCGKTSSLTTEQYVGLHSFAVRHLPKAVWDHYLWFMRFNKIACSIGLPVDDGVADYMKQNDRLWIQEGVFGDFERARGANKDSVRTAVAAGSFSSRDLGSGKVKQYPTIQPHQDALQLYEALTGLLPREKQH